VIEKVFPSGDLLQLAGEGFKLTSLVVGPLLTNCYILTCGDHEALVIDPGGDAEAIIESLRRSGLQVRYILATHAHFDHVGAIKALQDAFEGETLLHRADLPLLENLVAQGASFGIRPGPVPRVDRFVEEGELLSLGRANDRIQVIHTPGHSPGGISFVALGMAFVGDTLFAGSIGRTDLPGGCHQVLLDSIRRKLLSLEDRVLVFPGHGEVTTIGQERKTNPFLREGDG